MYYVMYIFKILVFNFASNLMIIIISCTYLILPKKAMQFSKMKNKAKIDLTND